LSVMLVSGRPGVATEVQGAVRGRVDICFARRVARGRIGGAAQTNDCMCRAHEGHRRAEFLGLVRLCANRILRRPRSFFGCMISSRTPPPLELLPHSEAAQ